eukprot:8620309-Pyramimonas_sp.AAC.1
MKSTRELRTPGARIAQPARGALEMDCRATWQERKHVRVIQATSQQRIAMRDVYAERSYTWLIFK